MPSDFLVLNALLYWGLSILIVHQIKLFTEKGDPARTHRTLSLFFLLNILVSVGNLLVIMFITRSLNPYQFEGMNYKYFIGTGDKIMGITFDFSLTNAIINALALIYFMRRKQVGLAIASMCVLLMTGSNFTNALMVVVLIYLFLFRSDRVQKISVGVCFLLMLLFLKVISPENKDYAADTFEKISGEKSFSVAPPDSSQHLTVQQQAFLIKAEKIEDSFSFVPSRQQSKWPGKLISYQETVQFLQAHPGKIALGNGAGRFSSKLAFRATSLDVSGGYPAAFRLIDPDFLRNHLSLFLYYFTKGAEHHSIMNTPNSVYNQMLGEYGLAGLAAMAIFYFGFFLRHFRRLTYGIPALLVLAAVFLTDYWFEQLSVVIVFELLLFLDAGKNDVLDKKQIVI